MGKESLEAHELIESVTEGLEEREHKRDEWNIRVALTTSVLAVFCRTFKSRIRAKDIGSDHPQKFRNIFPGKIL